MTNASVFLGGSAADAAAEDEATRVTALRRLGALDQPRRAELDGLARLAAHVCGASAAAINLIDLQRQWSAGAFGWDPPEVPRQDTLCNVSIRSRDVSYTEDASLDPRWVGNPFTTGELADIRLYAAAPLVLSGGEVIGTVCAFSEQRQELTRVQIELLRDIADVAVRMLEMHETTLKLSRAALRDQLTGLPSRALLNESLSIALRRHSRGESVPAVLFMDVDGFKAVNDTWGHGVGDELLRGISGRLLETVRGSDLLTRVGGDEFVVLCEQHGGGAAEIAALTDRIRAAFTRPFLVAGHEVTVGISVGVAVADGADATQLIARADADMYRDKLRRRNRRPSLRSVSADVA